MHTGLAMQQQLPCDAPWWLSPVPCCNFCPGARRCVFLGHLTRARFLHVV